MIRKNTGTIEIVAPLSHWRDRQHRSVPDVVLLKKSLVMASLSNQRGKMVFLLEGGAIGKIFETNHAFSIESDSGIELFVHFGIDTVELKGEGFKRIAEEGQRARREEVGDPVIEFDLPLLEEKPSLP